MIKQTQFKLPLNLNKRWPRRKVKKKSFFCRDPKQLGLSSKTINKLQVKVNENPFLNLNINDLAEN